MWNSFPSVVNSLAGSLPAVLISTTTLSTEERKEKLNAVKMSVFLLCKLTETLEGHSSRQSIVSAPGKVWIIITHTHTPCWALLMVQSLVLIWLNVLFFFCSVTQGGKKGKAGEGLLQWDSERERVLQVLIQLLQLDIRSLWNLSLVEEEFVRYWYRNGRCCFH